MPPKLKHDSRMKSTERSQAGPQSRDLTEQGEH